MIDKYGQALNAGDFIAIALNNEVYFGRIDDLTAKMVRYTIIDESCRRTTWPNKVIRIDGDMSFSEQFAFLLLSNG